VALIVRTSAALEPSQPREAVRAMTALAEAETQGDREWHSWIQIPDRRSVPHGPGSARLRADCSFSF
jgi:hypothetical protein